MEFSNEVNKALAVIAKELNQNPEFDKHIQTYLIQTFNDNMQLRFAQHIDAGGCWDNTTALGQVPHALCATTKAFTDTIVAKYFDIKALLSDLLVNYSGICNSMRCLRQVYLGSHSDSIMYYIREGRHPELKATMWKLGIMDLGIATPKNIEDIWDALMADREPVEKKILDCDPTNSTVDRNTKGQFTINELGQCRMEGI